MDAPSPSKKLQTCARPPPYLSKEIIQEILQWLPVKPLLRFRCVSKSWRSLIDSKLFIKTHLRNSIKNHSFPHQTVILHSMNERPNQSSLLSLLDENSVPPSPLISVNTIFRILGCCNGLVCVLDERMDFLLWNPSTRVISKKLPRIFGKRYEILVYGFGCVESSNEYKVFAFLRGLRYGGRVYSSSTKSWKTIKQSVNLRFSCEEGVFVGGKLHWPTKSFILTFDLKREAYGSVEFPPDHEPRFDACLGVVGGFLCVVYYCLKGRGNRVWVMKDGSWKRVATLRHVLLLLGRPFSSPFALIQNKEILLFHGSTFLIYSSLDEAFCCPKIFRRYQSQHLYVESLVSPESL